MMAIVRLNDNNTNYIVCRNIIFKLVNVWVKLYNKICDLLFTYYRCLL